MREHDIKYVLNLLYQKTKRCHKSQYMRRGEIMIQVQMMSISHLICKKICGTTPAC